MADNTVIYNIEYPEGDYASVTLGNGNYVNFNSFDVYDSRHNVTSFTIEEAIAASRAILKHFDAEDDASDHYRAPTEEELAKFLAENPKYNPIPKEAYDPDAPITS